MTAPAERIKARNRGAQLAAPASASRIASLDHHGLRYERLDDLTALVEGTFLLNLAGSHWHLVSDPRVHGYLVSALAAEIKKRKSEKPVTGRDGVAEGGRAANGQAAPSTMDAQSAVAESVAGAPSSSLLPDTKWP